jgi:hypothetical protein
MEDLGLVEFLIAASVREPSAEDYKELEQSSIIKNYQESSAGPIGKDGKPRMLLVSAWMVHEGRNKNAQAFIKEELETAVNNGLFAPPHAGMIDYDHDFTARGYWYKTAFAFDKEAEAWGIRVDGALWAWRYPELANELLAEMEREGFVPVSMTAKPESLEITHSFPGAEDEATFILHNPVFFTTSVLSIEAADEKARAVVSDSDTPNKRVLAAKVQTHFDNLYKIDEDRQLQVAKQEDSSMDEKLIDKLRQEVKDAEEAVRMAEAERDEAVQSTADVQAQLDTANETITSKDEEIETTKTKLAELEVALQAAAEAKDTVENELKEAKEKLDVFEAKEAEAAATALLEARLQELPEVVRKNLDEHPDKEALLTAWKTADEESWETIRQTFSLSDRPDYVSRSDDAGRLSTGSGDDKTGSILQKHIR